MHMARRSVVADEGEDDEWAVVEGKVADMCRTWSLSEGWKFCVKRVGRHETKRIVEAVFSIPTRRRPVPTATASVLFAVDVGAAASGTDEILFSVETQDLIHDASTGRFAEQWLYDVLAAKRLTHGLADEILGPGPTPV